MKSSRVLLVGLAGAALVLSCSASGAREAAGAQPSEATAAKTQYREGLSGVDFMGLDETAKNRALDIMNQAGCDCGCGMTVAQCRVEDSKCPRSPGLAKQVVDGVKAGRPSDQIAASLKAPAAPTATPPPAQKVDISYDGVRFKGNAKAPVTLVEYADFQCPYCVRAVPTVEQVLNKYPNDVRYAFKQLPLTSIHKFAEPAAKANLAAARQGKFWEMHDILFRNSRALDDASLRKYAGEIGLDVAKFEKDLVDPAIAEEIQRDVAESQRIGVNGTPTFFINGIRVPYADVDTLSQMVEAGRSGGDVAKVASEALAKIQAQQVEARKAQAAMQAEMAKQVLTIDLTGAPIKGDPKAPVTIVEFGDFQCPYCAGAQALLKQVMDAYPGKVKLAFKHLPLVSIHPNARPAALAAAEAMEQGKFWEMKELLYKNYSKLDRPTLSNLARQAGLDMDRFEKSLQNEEQKQVVDKDMADSQRMGVNSTPTFFVNGKRVMNRDFETFKRMIDEALATPPRAAR